MPAMAKSEKEEARLKFLEKEATNNIYRKTMPSVITAVVFGAVVFLAVSYLFDFSGRPPAPARHARSPAAVPPVVYPRSIPTPSMAAPRVITPRDYKTQHPEKAGLQERLKRFFAPASLAYEPPIVEQLENLPKPKHWMEYDLHCDPGLVGHDDCEAVQRSLIEIFKATDRK